MTANRINRLMTLAVAVAILLGGATAMAQEVYVLQNSAAAAPKNQVIYLPGPAYPVGGPPPVIPGLYSAAGVGLTLPTFDALGTSPPISLGIGGCSLDLVVPPSIPPMPFPPPSRIFSSEGFTLTIDYDPLNSIYAALPLPPTATIPLGGLTGLALPVTGVAWDETTGVLFLADAAGSIEGFTVTAGPAPTLVPATTIYSLATLMPPGFVLTDVFDTPVAPAPAGSTALYFSAVDLGGVMPDIAVLFTLVPTGPGLPAPIPAAFATTTFAALPPGTALAATYDRALPLTAAGLVVSNGVTVFVAPGSAAPVGIPVPGGVATPTGPFGLGCTSTARMIPSSTPFVAPLETPLLPVTPMAFPGTVAPPPFPAGFGFTPTFALDFGRNPAGPAAPPPGTPIVFVASGVLAAPPLPVGAFLLWPLLPPPPTAPLTFTVPMPPGTVARFTAPIVAPGITAYLQALWVDPTLPGSIAASTAIEILITL